VPFPRLHPRRTCALLIALLSLMFAACATTTTGSTTAPPVAFTPPPATVTATPTSDLPEQPLTVDQLRAAYGIDALINQGVTGKGQTIIDIVSYGSPNLVQDMATFSQRYNLPAANIQQLSPIGTTSYDPGNSEMQGWAIETELDVEIMHAVAPDAKIVVLTSPVDETEGTVGLPQFRQLLNYALAHHLGNVVSQSWGASEVSLKDSAGRAEVAQWDALYHQSTIQQGITYLASSGDLGATDYLDAQRDPSPTRTVSFPADEPWVTSVGGTTLETDGTNFREVVWNTGDGGSNGGFSTFFSEPSYQQSVAANASIPFNNERGIPDVAADADSATGLELYISANGGWAPTGGTSASAPVWAGLVALGNQLAGHSLGFIDPALYKLATSSTYARDFHDITVGNNTVTPQGGATVQGFNAGTGWDPVTGLGTPDAQYLLPDLIAAQKSGT
jgi:subtilase family serine protease